MIRSGPRRSEGSVTMPDNPEADPLYPCIYTGQAELDLHEGKTNLILAKRFPSKKAYAQRAYDAFVKSMSQEAMCTEYRCNALVRQADAARCVGNMDHFFGGLEEGLRIARQIGDQEHITIIITVLQDTPRGWRKEKRYKDLDAMIREIMTPEKS